MSFIIYVHKCLSHHFSRWITFLRSFAALKWINISFSFQQQSQVISVSVSARHKISVYVISNLLEVCVLLSLCLFYMDPSAYQINLILFYFNYLMLNLFKRGPISATPSKVRSHNKDALLLFIATYILWKMGRIVTESSNTTSVSEASEFWWNTSLMLNNDYMMLVVRVMKSQTFVLR